MVEIAGMTTSAPNARLALLLGVLLAALSLGAWAQQAKGLSDRCRDRAQAEVCPETCAAECANASSSGDILICLGILQAIHRGEKDRPSCHGSGPMSPTDEPVPNDIALGELKELCGDPQFAKVCPNTCYPLCDRKDLRKDQLHTFQLVLQAMLKGAKDRPSCQRQASGYATCKQRGAEHFKDFTPPSPPRVHWKASMKRDPSARHH